MVNKMVLLILLGLVGYSCFVVGQYEGFKAEQKRREEHQALWDEGEETRRQSAKPSEEGFGELAQTLLALIRDRSRWELSQDGDTVHGAGDNKIEIFYLAGARVYICRDVYADMVLEDKEWASVRDEAERLREELKKDWRDKKRAEALKALKEGR